MIFKVVLLISILINIALYKGWVDVGQYQNYVDKTIVGGKEILEAQATQDFLSFVKTKVQEIYGEDIDILKSKLKNQSKEQVEQLIQQKFANLSEQEIDGIVEYITGTGAAQ